MSRAILGISTGFLGHAVLSLRKKLGWSQEKLAREIGCNGGSGTVRQWEKNRRRINLLALQKMIDLSPDEETRLLFDPGRILSSEVGQSAKPSPQPRTDPELEVLASVCLDGVNLVYEAAAAGHEAAREVLRDLADKLVTRGGNWRRMKYLRNLRNDLES
jgi:transcriptional regulator with XRE-family HTH domain